MSARRIDPKAGTLGTATVVAIGTLMLTAASAAARDTGQERETLDGLARTHVVVYLEGATEGFSARALQTEVEQALRGVGLQVISDAQLQSDIDAGLLIVSVGSVENKRSNSDQLSGYAYRTDLNLWQITTLNRASWIRTYSATWQAPMRLGTCAPDALAADVRQSIGGQVEQFLTAYRAANPKKRH